MRYADAPEQQAWRQEVRRFVRRHVTPALRAELRAHGNEGEGPLARAFHRQIFDKGWWGIAWPTEFGGLGKSAVDQYIFVEEMEAAGAPAMRLSITSVAPTIRRVGTEAQKERWLRPILHGEVDFAIGYSEPDAGTDLAALKTGTVLDGRPLGAVPWVRRAIADLEMRVEVGRQLGLLNAWLVDQGVVPTKEGSMAKVYVTELNARLASVGMEILGLAGQLAPDDPAAPLHGRLQWLYMTAPLQRFGGGTNEIQRCIIAQRGLGLPRK